LFGIGRAVVAQIHRGCRRSDAQTGDPQQAGSTQFFNNGSYVHVHGCPLTIVDTSDICRMQYVMHAARHANRSRVDKSIEVAWPKRLRWDSGNAMTVRGILAEKTHIAA